jgi:hypothetical protein
MGSFRPKHSNGLDKFTSDLVPTIRDKHNYPAANHTVCTVKHFIDISYIPLSAKFIFIIPFLNLGLLGSSTKSQSVLLLECS